MREYELARIFGLFLTLFAIGVLFNREHIRKAVKDIAEHDGLQIPAALFPMLVGCYLIIVHNIWAWNWSLVLTLFGWLIFLAGAFRCLFVSQWVSMLKKLNAGAPIIGGLVLLAFGVLLLVNGFIINA